MPSVMATAAAAVVPRSLLCSLEYVLPALLKFEVACDLIPEPYMNSCILQSIREAQISYKLKHSYIDQILSPARA